MNYYKLASFTIILSIITSCSTEKEGDLVPDCSTSGLSINVNQIMDANCDNPGSFTAMGSGGTGVLRYSIDGTNFTQSGAFEDLAAGSYTVTVIDENECTLTEQVTVGSASGSIVVSVESQTTSDCNSATGSVTLSASDGNGDYQYAVDGGAFQDSPTFEGLSKGEHKFTAKDENGCSSTVSATILASASLANDIMPIINSNCATSSGCHGSGASGGRPDFSVKANIVSHANRIKARTSAGTMPPTGSLAQAEIDLIACWVDGGAQDN